MHNILTLKILTPGLIEKVWAITTASGEAKIVSVVRYGGPAQYGDTVSYKGEDFVAVIHKSSLTMYEVRGGLTTMTEAMALTEHMRERGMYIEVWSMTMAGNNKAPAPLRAGLMASDPHKAAAALAGRGLYYPTLMVAVGDELGAWRHKKAIASGARQQPGHTAVPQP